MQRRRIKIAVGVFCLCFLALAGGMAMSAQAQGFLVRDGKAEAEIVLGANPGRVAKLAAQELQTHIEKITGAKLGIVAEPTGAVPVKVYVGRSAYTDKLNLGVDALKYGAFRMASGKDWMALLGNDWEFTPIEPWFRRRADDRRVLPEWDKITGDTFGHPHPRMYMRYNATFGIWDFDDFGSANAVYEFLRGLGVRWYFPGELGEIIPKAASIALPDVNRVVKPDFPMRALVLFNANTQPDAFLWKMRLGVNFPYDLLGATQVCHGTKFITLRDEMKAAHPEIYALNRGKRAFDHKEGQGAPCLKSPLFFEKHLKFVRAMFDHYKEPMLSVDVVDGYRNCSCDLCKDTATPDRGSEGTLSDHVWGHVNRMAQELYKSHPDYKVSGLSYGQYREPPQKIGPLSPNITLAYCQHRSHFVVDETREKFVARRNEWLKILTSKAMYTFDFHLFAMPQSGSAGVPVYFPKQIAQDLRLLKGVSLGDHLEVTNSPDPTKQSWHSLAVEHLNSYVTSRFWWDADQDLDALLEEYYTLFYGPAREEMKAFVEYCSANWPKMRTEAAEIDQALALLATAREAAGDTVYGKRVDLVVAYTARLKEIRNRLTMVREDVPSTRCLPRKVSELKLDGKLDDKFWESTRAPVFREVKGGGKARFRTTCNIAWGSDNSLYLGIRCQEPDMKAISIGTKTNDDPAIWNGDVIDIFIETQTHSYYQIAFNPAGVITDLDHNGDEKEFRWTSGAQVAVHKGDGFWTAEIRIPCAGEVAEETDPLNGISGRPPTSTYPWHINVSRRRARGKDVEVSAWSHSGKASFSEPARFGQIYTK